MADSIPQLKADINALQRKLSDANKRIADLEALPPQVITEKVPFETVRVEYREKVIEVPGPERVATVEVPVDRVVYVDKPVDVPVKDHTDAKRADALAIELLSARAEILDLKSKLAIEKKKKPKDQKVKEIKVNIPMPAETRIEYRERIVEVPVEKIVRVEVPVEKIVRVDNPAHVQECDRLKSENDYLRRQLDAARQQPPVVEFVERVVEKPVSMPQETVIEYRDRIKEVVVYRDNPDLVATIARLRKKLEGK